MVQAITSSSGSLLATSLETAGQFGLALGLSCVAGFPFASRRAKLIASGVGGALPALFKSAVSLYATDRKNRDKVVQEARLNLLETVAGMATSFLPSLRFMFFANCILSGFFEYHRQRHIWGRTHGDELEAAAYAAAGTALIGGFFHMAPKFMAQKFPSPTYRPAIASDPAVPIFNLKAAIQEEKLRLQELQRQLEVLTVHPLDATAQPLLEQLKVQTKACWPGPFASLEEAPDLVRAAFRDQRRLPYDLLLAAAIHHDINNRWTPVGLNIAGGLRLCQRGAIEEAQTRFRNVLPHIKNLETLLRLFEDPPSLNSLCEKLAHETRLHFKGSPPDIHCEMSFFPNLEREERLAVWITLREWFWNAVRVTQSRDQRIPEVGLKGAGTLLRVRDNAGGFSDDPIARHHEAGSSGLGVLLIDFFSQHFGWTLARAPIPGGTEMSLRIQRGAGIVGWFGD